MISPQSRVSLANKLGKSENEINVIISDFAKNEGFDYFLDFSFFIEIVQEMEFRKFEELQNKKNIELKNNLGEKEKKKFDNLQNEKKGFEIGNKKDINFIKKKKNLITKKKNFGPLLCSECPGWICYLEKVLGDKIIPYASEIKTPQLQCSIFIRNYLKKCGFIEEEDIYIVLISPCFDKKLEAAREEQKNNKIIIDMVLSTDEIYKWMLENKIDFDKKNEKLENIKVLDFDIFLKKFLNEKIYSLEFLENSLINCSDYIIYKSFTDLGTSNGYVNYFINRIFQKSQNPKNLSIKKKQKKNLIEYTIQNKTEKTETNLVFISGFKNIQNLIRKIKMRKCIYDYVEIMACPSGCLNGGGQILTDKLKKKKCLENLEKLHNEKKYVLHYDVVDRFIEEVKGGGLEIFGREDVFYRIEEIKVNNVTNISW